MANSVTELLDMLYEMIDDAKGSLGGMCKIDRDKALDILDEVRSKFPAEIGEAQKLVKTRDEYLNGARADAERIRKQAEESARRMTDDHEITTKARAKANEAIREAESRISEMTKQAEARSAELKRVANEYCEDALRRTEEALNEAVTEIRQSRTKFRSLAGMGAAPGARTGKAPYDADKDK